MMLSIFKSPVVLLGLVSMLMFSGMPKLVENSKLSPNRPFYKKDTALTMCLLQWTLRCALSGSSVRRRTR